MNHATTDAADFLAQRPFRSHAGLLVADLQQDGRADQRTSRAQPKLILR